MRETTTMFTVTMTTGTTQWGESVTLRVLNPDGTVCDENTWNCGPDGFVQANESDMCVWVSEVAHEFMETYFVATQEQAQMYREIGR